MISAKMRPAVLLGAMLASGAASSAAWAGTGCNGVISKEPGCSASETHNGPQYPHWKAPAKALPLMPTAAAPVLSNSTLQSSLLGKGPALSGATSPLLAPPSAIRGAPVMSGGKLITDNGGGIISDNSAGARGR